MAIFNDFIKLSGGTALAIRAASSATVTALTSDTVILCDATSAAITVNLPTLASSYDSGSGTGLVLLVQKSDASGNAVTLDASGSETINGATTLALAARYDTALIVAGPSEWTIMAASV